MFIQIDRAAHLPIYLQIEDTLRKLIAQGTLRPGERLPSTRQLATQVGVNRITIEAAFSKLEADGLINSHVGRGTFVNHVSTPAETRSAPASPDAESMARLWGPLFVDLRPAPMSLPALNASPAGKAISFVHAAPASDLFPAAEFRRCVDYVIKRRAQEVAGMGSSDGLPSLRSQLVRWFAQGGIESSEEEVIITTGCQQSMDLIRRILVGPGDALMMENPTYPGAVAALGAFFVRAPGTPHQPGRPRLAGFQLAERPQHLQADLRGPQLPQSDRTEHVAGIAPATVGHHQRIEDSDCRGRRVRRVALYGTGPAVPQDPSARTWSSISEASPRCSPRACGWDGSLLPVRSHGG